MDQAVQAVRMLYYGDNLPVLQTYLAAESVDLIYLDPPFYSQRNYQAFFKQITPIAPGQSKVAAFGDTWRWKPEVEHAYALLHQEAPGEIGRVLSTLRSLLGAGSLLAYLVMMGERLVELHRVLKPTGSLYLHCDPTASHYLKVLLDAIFGAENFRNEIVWFYKTGGASQRHFARKHDLIFFYSKSEQYLFHPLKEKSYMMHHYGFKKSTFLRDERGDYTWVYMKDVWELPAIGAADGQRLGYPTQKPEALLERIIQASSDPGGIVLDPFCGSGTSLVAAQRLGRGWIGIEKYSLGIAYQRYRLARVLPERCYTYVGGPGTLAEARQLARTDAVQFRWWALSLVDARPLGSVTYPRTHDVLGEIHGIVPARADDQVEQLVIVLQHLSEWRLCQRLCRLIIKSDGRWHGLIITLDALQPTTQEALSILSCISDPAIVPGSLRLQSIVELLDERESAC